MALPAGFAKCVGLAMYGGVTFLDTAVVPAAKQSAIGVVERCADRDAALGQALAGLCDRGVE